MGSLRAEEIFDCLDDDAAFGRLPALVARSIGARSATFHWRTGDQGALVLADTGYWSADQMTDYIDHFAAHDLWAQATMTGRTNNRLWAIDDLVPDHVYRNSIFYNEWIRPMGDDTYHCIGMSMAGPSGTGLIGIHRSRSQGAFTATDVARLNRQVAPLRRLLRVRGMLAEMRSEAGMLRDTLDRLAVHVIIATQAGGLAYANAPAARMIESGDFFTVRHGRLRAADVAVDALIVAAINKATCSATPAASAVPVRLARDAGALLTVAPVRHEERRCALLILRAAALAGTASHLQRLFGLTAAEAAVTVELAGGLSPAEIAIERDTSVQTVQTQLKVAASKLGCRRQAEIVALVARMEPVTDLAR